MARDPWSAQLGAALVVVLAAILLAALGKRHGIILACYVAFAGRALRGIDVINSGYLTDAIQYDEYALGLVRYWQGVGSMPSFAEGKEGFPTILAGIYYVLGYAPEVGYMINALAGGLTVVVIAAVTAEMGWHRAIRPAAWLIAIWPVGILYGGLLIRESIVGLLLAMAMWGAVRLYRGKVISGALLIIATGLVMIPMRGGLAFLVLVGLPLTLIAVSYVHFRSKLTAFVGAVIGAGFALGALVFLGSTFESSNFFEYNASVVNALNTGTASFGNAGIGGTATSSTFTGHLLRIPFTALGPFPWQLRNTGLLLAFVDALLWMGAWALAIYAAVRSRRWSQSLLFLVPTAALMVYLAAISTNFGLIIRLRGVGIAMLAPLVAQGYVLFRQARAERRERGSTLART